MDILKSKAKVDEAKFKRYLSSVVAKNLSALSEPCYRPDLKKHYYDLLKIVGLSEKDIREFTKRRWAGRKEANFLLHKEALSNFYIFLMQYFLKKNDMITYRNIMLFYMIRQYTNLMHRHMIYCVDEAFKYALETLTKTHLFSREKTIPRALYFLTQEMIKRYTKAFKENNLDKISLFIQESRTRIRQSQKSFLDAYFKIQDAGGSRMKSEVETTDDDESLYQGQSIEKGAKIIDNVVRKITVYRAIDRKAKEEARKISKINSTLANLITEGLTDTKHIVLITTVLKLFIKTLQDSNSLCGKKYYGHVRGLMALKRTVLKVYFKQQVNLLLIDILKDKKFMTKYSKLTNQTQFLINLFLAYYLTMILRNTIC